MKIAPCPFCGTGSPAKLDVSKDIASWWVTCHECGAEGPRCFESDGDAIASWNNRHCVNEIKEKLANL